jgi:hypothetical protein
MGVVDPRRPVLPWRGTLDPRRVSNDSLDLVIFDCGPWLFVKYSLEHLPEASAIEEWHEPSLLVLDCLHPRPGFLVCPLFLGTFFFCASSAGIIYLLRLLLLCLLDQNIAKFLQPFLRVRE